MPAIWHDYGVPSFLAPTPMFSFFDVAECIVPADEEYEAARARLIAWERKMGAAYFQRNAALAHEWFVRKKPWYL